MEVSQYKCDICGKIVSGCDYDSPAGWYSVRRRAGEKDFFHHSKDICAECVLESGFIKATETLLARERRLKDVKA